MNTEALENKGIFQSIKNLFGFSINATIKQTFLRIGSEQNSKQLNLKNNKTTLEHAQRSSDHKKHISKPIVKKLDPTYNNALCLIEFYHSLCVLNEPCNELNIKTIMRDRFFNEGQQETERFLSLTASDERIIASMNISSEITNFQSALSKCNGILEWDGHNCSQEHISQVTRLILKLKITYLALFVKLSK